MQTEREDRATVDHQFENLDADRFQQLVQSILKSAFPRTTCFPVGQPDGGRDATTTSVSDDDSFVVFQVKFSKKPTEIPDIRDWLLAKFDGEKKKINDLKDRGATEYILITNASGSAHLDVGSIDRTLASLRAELNLPIQVWWRDDLNRRLDSEWNIKLRYPEILSGHDFFRLLLETSAGRDSARRSNALKSFLADQYEEDVDVKFKQIELHNKLLDLFIDLPFRLRLGVSPQRTMPARISYRIRQVDKSQYFVESDESRDDQGTAAFLLDDAHGFAKQIVVEGAPGQGKSTLAQYLCQIHRIRVLQKADDLVRLPSAHRTAPLKVPFKVDLRDLGAWLSGMDPFASNVAPSGPEPPRTLETFLAKVVSHRSGGIEFDVNDLLELSKTTPLLVVLDGLDEVVDIKQRSEVVAAVTKSAPRLRELCPDLSIVVTSRPAAFANSPGFDTQSFPHLELRSVGRSQISTYAERWMEVRRLSQKEKLEFNDILSEKMEAPHMRDLARNPMQLAILLSLILTQGAALPDKRTSLYDAYVDLFFSREASKSPAVRKHIDLLKELHGYLGWSIHSRAEIEKSGSTGRISDADLRAILSFYLAEEDHGTDVIDEVFNAMLERVVMIVSRIQGTYEFEVQPLREYFAARYLYNTASYSPPGRERKGTKPDRFDAIARNSYWLNVVRFFCGCFSKGELLDLADRVKELIGDPVLGKSRRFISLAAMLLSDWVFAQSPKATAQLLESLCTADGLRRLAPPTINYSSAEPMSLPERSGGFALFTKGFELMENAKLESDQLSQVARVVSQQVDAKRLVERWLATNLGRENLMTWLEIGLATEALTNAPRDSILERIGGAFSQAIVLILIQADRVDCIPHSESHSELLRDTFLSVSDPYYAGSFGGRPFFLMPALVGENSAFDLSGNRSNLLRITETLPSAEIWVQEQLRFIQECYAISREFPSVLQEPSPRKMWAGYEGLLERCAKLWGPKPAILRGVISFVDGRRVSPSASTFDFFDDRQPMTRRYRAAKARRSEKLWWRKQFAIRGKPADRNLLLLAHYREASLDVILDCADVAGRIVDEFSGKEWVSFLDMFESLFEAVGPSSEKWDSRSLSSIDSIRVRCLLAIRGRAAVAMDFFLNHCVNERSDVCGPRLRQLWAIEALQLNRLDWTTGLEIIASTYAAGAWSSISSKLRYARFALPPSVCDEILGAPARFPQALWELAERSATGAVAKAVRPVGAVAKAERWFAS